MSFSNALMRLANDLLDSFLKSDKSKSTSSPRRPRAQGSTVQRPGTTGFYLGDWNGSSLPTNTWAAKQDGDPDPGEVAWAWVPFEEDHSQGKDRPVVIVAKHPQIEDAFLALMLTSKDHDRDAEQERRAGRLWMDVGTGAWDKSGRPSEVRLNRVLQLRRSEIRREGSAMDREMFTRVVERVNSVL